MGNRNSKAPDFFIFGCERGGTTLLARLLSAQPAVFAVNDSFLYQHFAKRYAAFRAGGQQAAGMRLKRFVRNTLAQKSYFVYKQAMNLRSLLRRGRPESYLPDCDNLPGNDYHVSPALALDYITSLMEHYRQPLPGQKEATWLAEYADQFDKLPLPEETLSGGLSLGELLDAALYRVVTPVQREKSIVGEKTPAHIYYAPWLRRLYPNAKIITLMRSPISNVAAIYKRNGNNLDAAIDLYKSVYHPRFAFLYDGSTGLPLRYEHLIHKPEESMAGIFGYLGVRQENAPVDLSMPGEYIKQQYTGGGIDPERDKKLRAMLNPQQQEQVKRECAHILKMYYPEEL